METISMSRKERKRLEAFSRVTLGGMTLVEASERLGLSYRQTKRAWSRYQSEGSERRRCRSGASAAWPSPKSAFAGGGETAVAGVVSPAVCRLRADVGGGMLGEGRRHEGLGDNATAVAVAGGLVGRRRKRRQHRRRRTRREHLGESCRWTVSSLLVRGPTRSGGADGHDRRWHGKVTGDL